MLKEAEKETDRVLKEVRSAARKAQVAIDEQSLQQAKQGVTDTVSAQNKRVNKTVGRKEAPKLKHVEVGEEVMVVSLQQKGIVTSPVDKNGNVEVRIGIMPMRIAVSNLARVKEETVVTSKKAEKKKPKGNVSYNMGKTSTISTEVDVRGMMVEEAWQIVDKYLDDAYLSGLKQVTIIHGKGTGALRAGITQKLRKHPHVEGHRPGNFGEGEMGVTVVTVK